MIDKNGSANPRPKIVVITGASSGIGKACREEYLSKGDTVISLSRTNDSNFENFFACDVAVEEQVQGVFSKIKSQFGRVDILLNNAGFGLSGAVELTHDEDVKKIFDVNVLGVINCYKHALPLMGVGAKIINISSVCALFPLPFRSLYCASKSAVQMFSLCASMECAPFGVKVLSVCPGEVRTNFTHNRVKNYETNDRYKNRITLATNNLDEREQRRMSADKVAKVIYKYSILRHPRPFIIIGAKYKMLHFAMRLLPTKWLLHFTEKYFGGHEKIKSKEKANGR